MTGVINKNFEKLLHEVCSEETQVVYAGSDSGKEHYVEFVEGGGAVLGLRWDKDRPEDSPTVLVFRYDTSKATVYKKTAFRRFAAMVLEAALVAGMLNPLEESGRSGTEIGTVRWLFRSIFSK